MRKAGRFIQIPGSGSSASLVASTASPTRSGSAVLLLDAATLFMNAIAPAELVVADCGTSVPLSAMGASLLPPPPHAVNNNELAAKLSALRRHVFGFMVTPWSRRFTASPAAAC
jgi:hypothetical protein